MSTHARPLLWKVRTAPVHLFSSMHFAPPGGFDFGSSFAQIFDDAKHVFFEVAPPQMALVPKLAQRKTGTLSNELGSELYDLLRKSPKYGANLEKIKLPFVYTEVSSTFFKEIGLSFETGVEQMLQQRASANKQPCFGLETAIEQIEAFEAIPSANYATYIRRILKEPHIFEIERDKLMSAFVTGNASGLSSSRQFSKQLYGVAGTHILDNREANWVPRILREIRSGFPTIVVVGAMHLTGGDGLLGRLAAHGIEVEQVSVVG